jgi:hypothetical protein
MKSAKIIYKNGPYEGPYEKVTTYKLLINNKVIIWYENGKRGLKGKVGDIIYGIFVNQNLTPNYKLSNPINSQLKLF